MTDEHHPDGTMFSDTRIARVTVARFIARLGGEAAFFVGIWGMAAYRFQATSGQIAVLMASVSVMAIIGSAIAGTLVDRYGPRTVLIGAQVLYVPVALAVPMVSSFPMLVFACSLFGLTTAPIMTATGSFAPYLVDGKGTLHEQLERVNALLEGAGALSFVIGPGVGALFARYLGIESVFYLDAVLTTAGMLLVLPVRTPPVAERTERHPVAELTEGLKISYGIAPVRYYVLMGTLVWFSFGAFATLEPLFYRDVVGTGIETVGWVNSLFGIGIAAGAWMLTRLPSKATSAKGLALGVAGVGLGASVYIGTTNLVIIGAGAVIFGGVIGLVDPMLRTLMQMDAPEQYVGRVMGTAQIHRSAGELVPLALAPALAAMFGVQAVMMGGGAIAAIVALATLGYAGRLDRIERRPAKAMTFAEAYPKDEPITPVA